MKVTEMYSNHGNLTRRLSWSEKQLNSSRWREDDSSCCVRAACLVTARLGPPRPARAGWKVAVSSESRTSRRSESAHAHVDTWDWRGLQPITARADDGSSVKLSNGAFQYRLKAKQLWNCGKIEKEVLKLVLLGGFGDSEERADVYFVSCWGSERTSVFFYASFWKTTQTYAMAKWRCFAFCVWIYFKHFFISRNKPAWVRPPPLFFFFFTVKLFKTYVLCTLYVYSHV